MIPITTVRLGAEEEALVLEVLRSGMLAQGKKVEEFERRFAEMHGVRHAVAVNNGTTALVVAMEALGVGPGDEVVTSPFTFVATLNAILEAGATARFADIGDDFNVDVDQLAAAIGPTTAAICPVHLYGYPADMARIAPLAAERGIHLVEDAAQAHLATVDGRAVGSFGVGCFSLYATKNLSTGEGGMVTTNDDAVADRLRVLRNQGMRARYQYEMAGHNYRLTDLAAAVGLPQLDRLAGVTDRRRANAARLNEGLADVPGLVTPAPPAAGRTHVWHQYTIRITPEARLTRDDMVQQLTEAGVGCGIYYPKVVYDYDCYRSHARVVQDPVPNATRIATEVISLPVHQYLSDEDLATIVATVRRLLGA